MKKQLQLKILRRMNVDGNIYVAGDNTYTGNNVGVSNRNIRRKEQQMRVRLARQEGKP
jgi:hypothetical protein